MEVLRHAERPTEPADERHFEGEAELTRFLPEDRSAPGRVYRVSFTAGARTHWHTHNGVQLIVVVEGQCRIQARGGPVTVADVGDVVRIHPGEEHWHGATADAGMVHLAVNLGTRTDWLEPVQLAREST